MNLTVNKSISVHITPFIANINNKNMKMYLLLCTSIKLALTLQYWLGQFRFTYWRLNNWNLTLSYGIENIQIVFNIM